MDARIALAVLGMALASCSPAESAKDAGAPQQDASRDQVDSGHRDADASVDADGGDPGDEPDAGEPSSGHDVFGVSELYPTAAGGLEWDSRWWQGDGHNVP